MRDSRFLLTAICVTGAVAPAWADAWDAPVTEHRRPRTEAAPAPVEVPAPIPIAAPTPAPAVREVQLSAPLRDNGHVLGELPFRLNHTIRVSTEDLLRLLRPILSAPGYGALELGLAGRSVVTSEELAQLGYTLTFNQQTLQLDVAVPTEARALTTIRLADGRNSQDGEFATPARLSAYLNARAAMNHLSGAGDAEAVDQFAALFDFAARFNGVVFESEGSYYNEPESRFRREGSRFVHDNREHVLRFTLGDLRPQSRGFQTVPSMAGISVVRSYALLDPTRNLRPSGRRSFTLTRPSTIQAVVNGRTVRRFRLQPGAYDIEDLPFEQGANDVQIIAEDDAGGREVFAYSFYFARTLLEPGQDEFALFAGIESGFSPTGRTYESEEWILSGSYRRGLTSRLAAGANALVQRNGYVLGAEATVATPYGTVGGEIATSSNDVLGSGYAFNGSLFNTIELTEERLLSYAVAYETRSENMASPSMTSVNNRFSGEFAGSLALGLTPRQHISLNSRYSLGRGAQADEHSIRVAYGHSLSPRLTLNVEAFQRVSGGADDVGARIELNFRVNDRSSATAQYETADQLARIAYDTSRGEGVGSWSAGADIEHDPENTAVNAAFSQTLNRARWGVSHTAAFTDLSLNDMTNSTSLRAASAVAFADGAVALSRPIYDSFVLVRPHESLGDAAVVLEPSEEGYAARSGWFGAASLPEISAYSPRTVTYDVPDAPDAYDIGAGSVRVFPEYRSGYLETVGSDYSLSAVGRLVDDAGAPVTLLAGHVFEVSEPDRPPIVVFTNRDGRFGAFGLRAGAWRIVMPNGMAYQFNMPESPDGLTQVGQLAPEQRP